MAGKRRRSYVRHRHRLQCGCIEEAEADVPALSGGDLSAFGLDAAAVEDVVLTHCTTIMREILTGFRTRNPSPGARTCLCYGAFHAISISHSFEVKDVCGIVRLNYARRVLFYDGDAQLAPASRYMRQAAIRPGFSSFVSGPAGGSSCWPPTQSFYENMASERPFTTALHIGEMLEGFDKLLKLAPDESHIIPGHDPLVMKLYPAPSPELEGIAVRLDVTPSRAAPVRADYLSGTSRSRCDLNGGGGTIPATKLRRRLGGDRFWSPRHKLSRVNTMSTKALAADVTN